MILGLDIGGTKTHLLAVSALTGEREKIVPTHSWWRSGSIWDADTIARLWDLVSDFVNAQPHAVLVVGAHGCETPEQCQRLTGALQQRHRGPVHVTNDARLVVPAANRGPGIGLIVGTGSIVVGVDRDGKNLRAGGYGWQLGDPGSAITLVRESVRRILVDRDNGCPRDALARRLMRKFGVADELDLIGAFSRGSDISAQGEAVEEVFAAAQDGSVAAGEVIAQGAVGVAVDIHRVRSQGAVGTQVVCAGGVITNNESFFRAIQEQTARLEPDLDFSILSVPPVYGAIALGRQIDADIRGPVGAPSMPRAE